MNNEKNQPNKSLDPIPSDHPIFEGAETLKINKEQLVPFNQGPHGDFIIQGGYVICNLCPAIHTMPGCSLNPEGKLVRLDKPRRSA